MKFIIKHEIPGRIRVHMVQPKMTFEEADILLYYLVNLENVTKAKVYERTQDAVIYYEKDRREIIKAPQVRSCSCSASENCWRNGHIKNLSEIWHATCP